MYVYTHWNITAIKNEIVASAAICIDLEITKKSERKKHMISLMRNIKYDTDETTHKREKESQTQRIDWIAKGEGGGRGVNREFGFSLEGMMLKLKLQYFGHLMRRADSLEKTLILGGIEGRRRRGRQRMRWLDGITNSMDMSLT